MPSRDEDEAPRAERTDDDRRRGRHREATGPEGVRERLHWLLNTDQSAVSFVRELLSSVLIVLLIGLLLFGISGVWPPMVAVSSGSMDPHMSEGDLVFVMDESRLAPSYSDAGTGVVSYRAGEANGYTKFGAYGDVIVFKPSGGDDIPVIHRAHFWVNESENWYDKANPEFAGGGSCSAIDNCPAPHAGFITKGDDNPRYDQVTNPVISDPVKPEWIRGTAEIRVPYLGHVRLKFAGVASPPVAVP